MLFLKFLILYILNWCSIYCSFIVLISLFIFLGLEYAWQYALNLEQYEIAQQLRNKLTEVSPLNLHICKISNILIDYPFQRLVQKHCMLLNSFGCNLFEIH